MPVTLVCKYCGRQFKDKPSHVSWRKFCSNSCRSKVYGFQKGNRLNVGRVSWCKGKKLGPESEETRHRKSLAHLGKTFITEEGREKLRLSKLGDRNPAKRPEVRLKISSSLRGRTSWSKGLTKEIDPRLQKLSRASILVKNSDPKYKAMALANLKRRGEWKPEWTQRIFESLKNRPTKLEMKVIGLIKRENLPIVYTGDGALIVGYKCPDFVVKGQAKLIEVFGQYWHSPVLNPRVRSTPEQLIEYYRNWGFDCLIIWEEELASEAKVVEKIRSFIG